MIEGQDVITGDHSETRGVRRHAHVLSRVVAKVKRLSIITEAVMVRAGLRRSRWSSWIDRRDRARHRRGRADRSIVA